MSFELGLESIETQAEITDVEAVKVVVVDGVWTEVPGISGERSKL